MRWSTWALRVPGIINVEPYTLYMHTWYMLAICSVLKADYFVRVFLGKSTASRLVFVVHNVCVNVESFDTSEIGVRCRFMHEYYRFVDSPLPGFSSLFLIVLTSLLHVRTDRNHAWLVCCFQNCSSDSKHSELLLMLVQKTISSSSLCKIEKRCGLTYNLPVDRLEDEQSWV